MPSTAFVGYPQIQADLAPGLALANCTSPTGAPCNIFIPKDDIQGSIGNYLVRAAISERSNLALLAIGLAVSGWGRILRDGA